MNRFRSTVALTVLFWSLAAFATVFDVSDDRQIIGRSDAIVTGTVRAAAARQLDSGQIVTDYTFDVEDVLKGNLAPRQSIVISEFGGSLGDRVTFIADSAVYQPGEHVMTFLRRRSDGTFYTTSMTLGKFDFDHGVLIRHSDEVRDDGARDAMKFARFIRAESGSPDPQSADLRSVDYRVRVGDSTAAGRRPALHPATNGFAKNYALLGSGGGQTFPVRWPCCGGSVVAGQPSMPTFLQTGSIAGTNTGAGISAGVAAWTNDPNASIVLGYDNKTTPTNPNAPNPDDGQSVIYLGYTGPDSGLCDGALGCTIGSGNFTHTFDGDTWIAISDADIIVRSAAGGNAFTTVITHELGHAIGIRHSDQGTPSSSQAIMTSVVNTQLGSTLQQWDRDAVDSIYGTGPVCMPPDSVNISGNNNPPYGSTVTLTANPSSGNNLNYQWYQGQSGDTSTPVGTNSPNFATGPITTTTSFWVKAFNTCGTVTSTTFTITPQACIKPSISAQPQNQTVQNGQSTILTVQASGSPALAFQWFQGTAGNINTPVGTNSASFTTPQLTSTTSYWVRVSNPCGTADSTTATVTVQGGTCTPPTITLQPSDTTIPSGSVAVLRGNGSSDVTSYQWFKGPLGNTSTPVSGLGPSNTRFVTEAYLDLLGRQPDAASLASFVNALNTNALSRTQVAAQITSSNEYRSDEISGLYHTYLRRAPSAAEVAFQLNQMTMGQPIDHILIGLLSADEYFLQAGGTNSTYVARLYNDILHRAPDSAAQSLVDALNGGASRLSVATTVVNSTEAHSVLIGLLYNQFLHRAPDPTGLSTFLALLNGGGSREQVIDALVGSDEYFNIGTILITDPLTQTTTYWFQARNACGGSVNSRAATVTVGTACRPPSVLSTTQLTRAPLTGEVFNIGVAADWGDGTTNFQWFLGASGDTSQPIPNSNAALLPAVQTNPGTYQYWVRVSNACGSANSSTITVTVACGATAPTISSPGSSHTGYTISWNTDARAVSGFELQESQSATFGDGSVRTFSGLRTNSQVISHPEVTSDTRFFYRVRAIAACNGQPGPYSTPVAAIALAPPPTVLFTGGVTQPLILTTPAGTNNFSTSFTGNLLPAVQATAATGGSFQMTLSEPWVTISPSSGSYGPDGNVQFTISVDSSQLPTGASYATLTTVVTPNASGKTALGSTTSTTSVNVSLVTPVTPATRDTNPPAGTLLIPAVAHADGINSKFQSDVRITNTSLQALTYSLFFTPTATNGLTAGLSTTVSIAPGETKAFDDIVKTWFGGGTGSSASALGTVEIRPQSSNVSFTTAASSRTYNVTTNGTFGQFIPALALTNFLTKSSSAAKISLQQIAQSAAYRTNVGFAEGSGQPVTFNLRLVDDSNNTIASVPVSLQPYEHVQQSLGTYFPAASNLADARLEVQVTSDTGSVTAYASVLDNITNDPLLVFPVDPVNVSSTRFVIPGVAELNNGAANFHTDTRLFNAGATPVTVTLNYSPNDRSAPAPVQLTINPGEVKMVDNTLLTLWNITGSGGAVIVTAPTASSLVVTARTFSRRSDGGTYGQFIPAVAPTDGVGAGERPLEVLQLEQSPAFRSNLGLFELTGNSVNLEIDAFSPDSKVAVKVPVTLAGNQFQQLGSIFASVGFPTTYNGRIEVKVTGGSGRVSAYGSVIDNRTEDPTYVPAQ